MGELLFFAEPNLKPSIIQLGMDNFDNLKEVYLSDSHIDDSVSATSFRFRKINLPTFPKLAVDLFKETSLVFKKTILGVFKISRQYLANHPSHAAFSISSLLLLAITINEACKINNEYRDSLISDKLITEIASLSIFSRKYSSQLDNPGAPLWAQKESIKAIILNARKAGLSIHHQAVLLATAEVESGFNPLAKAKTSTACGIFQFINSTGQRYGLDQENCTDPWLNSEAAIKHYQENYEKKILAKVSNYKGIEKAFKTFELSYYLHHDGPSSNNPDDSVKAVVLKGTHFLIQAYQELKSEQLRNAKENEFTTKLTEVILAHINSIKTVVADLYKN